VQGFGQNNSAAPDNRTAHLPVVETYASWYFIQLAHMIHAGADLSLVRHYTAPGERQHHTWLHFPCGMLEPNYPDHVSQNFEIIKVAVARLAKAMRKVVSAISPAR
jgi:hypothetical protein